MYGPPNRSLRKKQLSGYGGAAVNMAASSFSLLFQQVNLENKLQEGFL